ncbi:hypothetical protein BJX66DRAFT_306619 [Aspergillus keveii]|uniref:Secreted protein n=1 Tax=Aspergillus keveii TaxID=714993 RepID=A0ABR4G237_9EURO
MSTKSLCLNLVSFAPTVKCLTYTLLRSCPRALMAPSRLLTTQVTNSNGRPSRIFVLTSAAGSMSTRTCRNFETVMKALHVVFIVQGPRRCPDTRGARHAILPYS